MAKLLYAKAVYGNEEKLAVLDSLNNSWLAAGEKVKQFETEIAELFGKKYAIATNSGSSANLLAITALGLPRGGEVITPACTFATTVAPIIQNGLTPVFVDCKLGQYTIDVTRIEEMITELTVAIVVPQLIGNAANMPAIADVAEKHNLFVLDDSCDTLAPKFIDKSVASYSDITTTSFYGSHIITTMGSGGMFLTDDDRLYQQALSLVNWGRVGSDNENFQERFDYKINDIPYDAKFIYSNIGYNMKLTEAQAAFGLEQLKRLNGFLEIRDKNFKRLEKYFTKYNSWFYLPESLPGVKTSWLAFPLMVRDIAPFKRYDFLKHLESRGVQTRVLFSGNITRHPAYTETEFRAGDLANSDKVMESGFLIGCHQGLDTKDIELMIEISEEFLCNL